MPFHTQPFCLCRRRRPHCENPDPTSQLDHHPNLSDGKTVAVGHGEEIMLSRRHRCLIFIDPCKDLSPQTCRGIRGMANLGCKHHNLCNAPCNQYAHANCKSSKVNHVLPSKGHKPCKVPNGYGAPDHTAGSSSSGKCCGATAMKYLHATHYVGLAQTKGHKLHIVLRRQRKLHKVVVDSSRIAFQQCVPHTNCRMECLVHPVMLMQLQTHLPKSQSPVR